MKFGGLFFYILNGVKSLTLRGLQLTTFRLYFLLATLILRFFHLFLQVKPTLASPMTLTSVWALTALTFLLLLPEHGRSCHSKVCLWIFISRLCDSKNKILYLIQKSLFQEIFHFVKWNNFVYFCTLKYFLLGCVYIRKSLDIRLGITNYCVQHFLLMIIRS